MAAHRFVLATQARAFLLISVLGGFTTFSSFSFETLLLLRDAEIVRPSLNAVGQPVVGLFAIWFGFVLARLL